VGSARDLYRSADGPEQQLGGSHARPNHCELRAIGRDWRVLDLQPGIRVPDPAIGELKVATTVPASDRRTRRGVDPHAPRIAARSRGRISRLGDLASGYWR